MIYLFIRVAAAIGGALVGFFLSGPALRVLYRLAFQRSIPGWMLPLGKLTAALVLGLLIFFFLPLGGGPGWGWGPGWGTGSGESVGKGEGPGEVEDPKPGKKPNVVVVAPAREKLIIELLGGGRVGEDGRFYLLNGETKARTHDEVVEYIKGKAGKLEVHVKLTDESVAASHPAVRRLHEVLRQYSIPTVTEEK